jgi:hypothetical protein
LEYESFVGLQGDKTYNTIVCGNTTLTYSVNLLNLSRKFITLNLLNLLLLYYLFITKKFINFLAIPSKPSRLHSTFPLWRFAWGQP